jgi:hypothetical protein
MSNVAYGVPWRIDGPAPVEQSFGLLQAGVSSNEPGVTLIGPDVDADGVERWGNGVSLYPYPPDLGDVYDACAPGSFGTTKGFGDTLGNPWFGAMTVWLAETCTSPRVAWAGDGGQQAFKARAQVALGAVEGAAIAYEFMTGLRMPSNPHLCDGLGTVYSTPTSVVNGIALLENYIAATSGKLGIIHCTPGAASVMGTFRIDNKAGYIRTINGTIVIPDFGYAAALADGNAYPAGYAAPTGSQEWMFATGPINIRRSELLTYPDNVIEALDRGTPGSATNNNPNSITYRAERYYAVTADFVVQAAVLVDRCYWGCNSAA